MRYTALLNVLIINLENEVLASESNDSIYLDICFKMYSTASFGESTPVIFT